MAGVLKFVGATCIVLALLVLLLVIVASAKAGGEIAAEKGDPAWIGLVAGVGWLWGTVLVAGLMATGAIMYVGGRALNHMDRIDRRDRYSGGSRPRRGGRRGRNRPRSRRRRIDLPPQRAPQSRRSAHRRPKPEDFGDY